MPLQKRAVRQVTQLQAVKDMAKKKHCVMSGKRKVKCFRKKSKAKKMAKARRKRGLRARVRTYSAKRKKKR